MHRAANRWLMDTRAQGVTRNKVLRNVVALKTDVRP